MVYSLPSVQPGRLMSRFWQYTQPRLQPPKKIAPEPRTGIGRIGEGHAGAHGSGSGRETESRAGVYPLMHGSSHIWSIHFVTRTRSPQPQYPSAPAERLTAQRRGQAVQRASASSVFIPRGCP